MEPETVVKQRRSRKMPKLMALWNDLNTKGFVEASNEVGRMLYRYPGISVRVFRLSTDLNHHGSVRCGAYDVFGYRKYYVVLNNPEGRKKIVEHLFQMFKAKNPTMPIKMRHVFSMHLHSYGLCWQGCSQHSPNYDQWCVEQGLIKSPVNRGRKMLFNIPDELDSTAIASGQPQDAYNEGVYTAN